MAGHALDATPAAGSMFPLDFPEITVDAGVFAPTQGSLLMWKYLYREGIGAHQRCLDIGCGSGLLTVQLARNGAAHVHAIDIDEAAVKNTMTNAFRNGLADRVSAAAQDLYPWVPEERYDVIVASLYQMPVDPFEQVGTHRPLDYWGRNLLDHLIRLLSEALADDGTAYVMQLSIIGERRTTQLLDSATAIRPGSSTSGSSSSTTCSTTNRPDHTRRGALGRLPPQARRRRCHGRLSDRGDP